MASTSSMTVVKFTRNQPSMDTPKVRSMASHSACSSLPRTIVLILVRFPFSFSTNMSRANVTAEILVRVKST